MEWPYHAAEIARAKFPHVYGRDAPFDAAQAALAALTARVLVLTPSTLSEILQRLHGLEEVGTSPVRSGDHIDTSMVGQVTMSARHVIDDAASNMQHLPRPCSEALIDHGVRLLVVDSMAALARAEFGRGQLVQRQELLGQIASVLKQQAERLHMAGGSLRTTTPPTLNLLLLLLCAHV